MGYNQHGARDELATRRSASGSTAKGDIAAGLDADLALVDPRAHLDHPRARSRESTQGYTPFEGIELGAR